MTTIRWKQVPRGRVTGHITPDCSGLYDPIFPPHYGDCWTRSTGGWSIWLNGTLETFVLSETIGQYLYPAVPYWRKDIKPANPRGLYKPAGTATGEPFVAFPAPVTTAPGTYIFSSPNPRAAHVARQPPARPDLPVKQRHRDIIREAAKIWNEEMTAVERKLWTDESPWGRGARPGGKPPVGTGWDIFVMYAYSPLLYGLRTEMETYPWDRAIAKDVKMTDADVHTQVMTFTAIFNPELLPNGTTFYFIYQVPPYALDWITAWRHCYLCGFHVAHYFPRPPHTFTAKAHFPFKYGDEVATMVRHHVKVDGVYSFTTRYIMKPPE